MSSYKTMKTKGNTDWFELDRFGMFIHWGLYSMTSRGAGAKTREFITDEEYMKFFNHFDPDLYDAKKWAKRAKEAGMKYAVLTTKHHEGFCLFDSKYTDYKCTNTPAGRDLVREYVDAFRAEGLKIGLYYSLIDWHHPEYVIDSWHPKRYEDDVAEQNKKRDMKKYAEYMRNQVRELLTNYGKIDIMWFDFAYDDHFREPNEKNIYRPCWAGCGKGKDEFESEKLVELIRSIQPEIILNNRMGIEQDIWTPEQRQLLQWVRHKETGELVTWETCQTFSGSWGHNRDEMTWKSPKMLIDMLINSVCIGGNLLMNVGPTPRGYFDERAENALSVYVDWMKYNSRSIYGCTQAEPEFECPRDCRLTQSVDGKRLYIHIMNYPFKTITMDSLAGKIEYAQFLHDGSGIQFTDAPSRAAGDYLDTMGGVKLVIPPVKPPVEVPVIEVFLK